MHSIRQTCRFAIQGNNATYPFANASRRAFSRSSAHQRGALPVFLPASSPGLTTLLSTLNAKILLPKHLTPEQEKLVYKQENRAKLESEPIEITLGDVTLPLEHIDRNRDIPKYSKHLREIVKQSKTQEDCENVLRMMEGFENAGIHVKWQLQAMIVRKLNRAGMQHLILKALQRPRETGLRLREWEVVAEVLRAVRDKAAVADWEEEDLRKALSIAEQVVELMEHNEHLGKVKGEHDHRTNPIVIAAPLELAAELAYRHEGDVEKVKKYALRFMNALQQNNFMASDIAALNDLATQREFKNTSNQAETLVAVAQATSTLIPVWNSLSTTRTVLDEEMPMAEDAERVQQTLWKAIEAGSNALDSLKLRDGKEISSPTGGYVSYVQDAIRKCQDADE